MIPSEKVWSEHGVGFTCACVSVSDHCAIKAFQEAVNLIRNVRKNVFLRR